MPEVHEIVANPLKTQRIVFGSGSIQRLGEHAARAGARALLVTDAGVRAVGHAGVCERVLRAAGLHVDVYDGVPENPSRADARALGAAARALRPDMVVAIGGGSAIDCAKGAVVEMSQPEGLDERQGHIELDHPAPPIFAIRT